MKPLTPPTLSSLVSGRDGIGHRLNPDTAALHLANSARLSALDKAEAMSKAAANPRPLMPSGPMQGALPKVPR